MDFEAAYDRMCAIVGVKTQTDLAKHLGIRQSSVSDAKRRQALPAEWLLFFVEEYRISPTWIREGIGDQYLTNVFRGVENMSISGTSFETLVEELRRRFKGISITLGGKA